MFSELAPTAASSTQTWAAVITAIAGAAAVLLKKRYNRTRNRPPAAPRADLITRVEFHQSLDATRDRITASYLAVNEKMDQNQKELVSAITHQEQRLDRLETDLARVDE